MFRPPVNLPVKGGEVLTRRDWLKRSSLIALAPSVPAFLAQTARAARPEKDQRVLVVIQLDGGNDGINTVVPYADEGYAANRDKLRIPPDRLLKLDDNLGLHPALRGAAELLESGQLAIVQGVGYPNPNRSHEVSMSIWHTARFDPEEHRTYGWIGRALDESRAPSHAAPDAALIGDDKPPVAIRARRSVTVALDGLDDLQLRAGAIKPGRNTDSKGTDLTAFVRRSALEAYATAEQLSQVAGQRSGDGAYPQTKLANRLRIVAQLIRAGFGTRVYYAVQGGYDTHYVQLPGHAELLAELSGALRAFLADLKGSGHVDQVAVLCFSEFGRRVKENASQGTDHGTAGPVLLAGSRLEPGLHGKTPSLSELDDGDLRMSVDFRQVYAAVLESWLGLPTQPALGGSFSPLPLFSVPSRVNAVSPPPS